VEQLRTPQRSVSSWRPRSATATRCACAPRCGSSGIDPSLAEEVVQEAFLSAWQHAPAGFDQAKGTLSTWLLTLTRHKAIDAGRHAEHVRRVQATELAVTTSRHERGADEAVLAGLDVKRLLAAVDELTVHQRRTVLLTYWGGLPQSEIALRDQTPVGIVKTRSRAALARLRELLPDRDLL